MGRRWEFVCGVCMAMLQGQAVQLTCQDGLKVNTGTLVLPNSIGRAQARRSPHAEDTSSVPSWVPRGDRPTGLDQQEAIAKDFE